MRRADAIAAAIVLAVFAIGPAPFASSQQPCADPPGAPPALDARIGRDSVTLTWQAPVPAPSSYVVEAGPAPGSTYLGTIEIGDGATTVSRPVAPGTYYVRVRAKTACGLSAPSREMKLVVDPEHAAPRTQPDVVVATRTVSRNTYFPSAARLKTGELVVVYYDSPDHVSAAGRLSMVRSADGGQTWSPPEVVVDEPVDERDPSVMETRDGRVLVSYFASDATRTPATQGPFLVSSLDRGRTWSAPAKVDTALRGAATSARIVEMDDGELLMPIHGGRPDGSGVTCAVVRSGDGGRTWPADRIATLALPTGVDCVEPAIASLGGGRLVAMLRTEGSDGRSYVSHSSDRGRTWSAPAKTEFAAQASDLLPILEGEGALLLHAWGDVSGRFGDSRPTVLQFLDARGFPRLDPASPPRVIYQGHCWADESYPGSVLLPGNRVLTVYYDACAGQIAGTFSPVPARR